MGLGGRVPFTDVALIDPAEEINELRGTLNSIQDVLDLDAMRKQIEELEEQAAAPDLWNDQDRAQKVTSKLSYLQGEVNRVESLGRRLEDATVLYELAAAEDDEETREEADRELASLKSDVGSPGGPHPAVGRVRRPRGGRHDPVPGGWRRRRRLGPDAPADVSAVGRAAGLPDRRLRDLLRGGGRDQVDDLHGQGALRVRHAPRRARHPPPGPDQPVRQPGPPPDLLRGRGRGAGRRARPTTSTSTRTTCASTSTGPRAPAARASTPPTRRSA